MGGCLSIDVEAKYEVGGVEPKTEAPAERVIESEDAVALLNAGNAFSTLVELSLCCGNLKHSDTLSKSDPMGILYEQRNGTWVECGRTEMIANSYDPAFVTRFRIMYNFEKAQKLRLLVVDLDKGADPETCAPSSCNYLGQASFELSEVVTAQHKLTRPLLNKAGQPSGTSFMCMTAEEVSDCKEVYRIRLQAHNLRNVDTLGKSDPFLQISRMQEDGCTWLPVYRTNVIMNCLKPVWKEVHVRAAQLNNGDVHRPLRLQVYDYEPNGSHRLLGQCEINTARLRDLAAQHGAVVSLEPPPGKKAGDYGSLQVASFTTEVRPTFLDYIAGGTEIGFVVAVDFTGSNGDPRTPMSKHYLAGGPTQYEQAIMGIGHVIHHYDTDKAFPMYGFGGRRPGVHGTDHCFPLGALPEGICVGVDGLLREYRRGLYEWQLSGPTHFAPVIRKAASMAAASVGGPPKYTCLLILTDGEVTDMQHTVNAIIDASGLPLSVLIVGIGRDDFGKMKALDADKRRLTSGNRTAVRDIVQFVEFEKFAGDGVRLAQELLAELPGQLLEYMRTNNVPCPPPGAERPPVQQPGMQQPAHGGYTYPPAMQQPSAGGYTYPPAMQQPGMQQAPGAYTYPQYPQQAVPVA